MVALLEPQREDTGPTAAETAAAELLEARSMLLAGEAGLCCNPRCSLHAHNEFSLCTSSLVWAVGLKSFNMETSL